MNLPKILHLATSLSGGAGIAARRIAEAQRAAGFESVLIANQSKGVILQNHENTLYPGRTAKFFSSANTFLQEKFIQRGEPLITSYSINLSNSIKGIIELFDVVHIHAFYNFLNLKSIVDISKLRPVVVTLHDQRFFTGGCHYSLGCTGFTKNCQKCPQVTSIFSHVPKKTLHESLTLLKDEVNIRFISPSIWLSELAKQSSLISNYEVNNINNPIPEIFSPDKDGEYKFKESLQIGFISHQLNNPYKGLDVLITALAELARFRKTSLKLFGKGDIPRISTEIDVMRAEYDAEEKAVSAIQSCDVIVVPSIQDNSPSVVSESLMCGVPVIGSRVGGIEEVLREFKLPTFQAGNSHQLFELLKIFKKHRMGEDSLKMIREKFSYANSALKHSRVYASALK